MKESVALDHSSIGKEENPRENESNWRQKFKTREEMLRFLQSLKINDSGPAGRRPRSR